MVQTVYYQQSTYLAGRLVKALFRKVIEMRAKDEEYLGAENEQETIADIFRRIEEIKEEVAHEHRGRKVLEAEVQEKLKL